MEIVVAPEFSILLIAIAIVYQYQPVAIFYQQAAKRPTAEIVIIGGVLFVPHAFGHYTKHGAAVELEKTGIDAIELHSLK